MQLDKMQQWFTRPHYRGTSNNKGWRNRTAIWQYNAIELLKNGFWDLNTIRQWFWYLTAIGQNICHWNKWYSSFWHIIAIWPDLKVAIIPPRHRTRYMSLEEIQKWIRRYHVYWTRLCNWSDTKQWFLRPHRHLTKFNNWTIYNSGFRDLMYIGPDVFHWTK